MQLISLYQQLIKRIKYKVQKLPTGFYTLCHIPSYRVILKNTSQFGFRFKSGFVRCKIKLAQQCLPHFPNIKIGQNPFSRSGYKTHEKRQWHYACILRNSRTGHIKTERMCSSE